MNILVLSDTHGQIDKAVEMYERLNALGSIDLVIHCGDYVKDARRIKRRLAFRGSKAQVIMVPGNCDGCRERDFETVEVPSGKILVTHGHMENVKIGYSNLLYLAEEQKCNAVCFGHTHRAVNEVVDGIRIVNPGSLTNPRDGSKGTCAFLVSSEKSLAATIVRYSI